MVNKLEAFKLGSRCTIKSSKRIFAREYVDEGIPFFRSKDVIDKALGVFSGYEYFISQERFNELKKEHGSPEEGDLLLSSVGNRSGQPYVVRDEGDFYFKDGNIIWISEFNGVHPDFLAYWFKSHIGQSSLNSVMIGSAQKALTIDSIRNLKVSFPLYAIQKSIAHILGKLDDKIELNRQMSETLEAMAQALFKSWFVDFDPVIDNALLAGKAIPDELAERAELRQAQLDSGKAKTNSEINDLFPSEFEFTEELGWIPKGWEVKKLAELAEKISKGTTPRKAELETADDEAIIPFIKVKDIDDSGFIDTKGLDLIPRSIHESSIKRSILKEGDVLFSIAGTIGRTSIIPKTLDDSNANQAVAFIRPKSSKYSNFIHQALKSERVQHRALSRVVQAVQANFSLTELGGISLTKPSDKVFEYWYKNTDSIYQKISELQENSDVLAKLRDTLLPKLMSGELLIADAEKLVADI